MSVLFQNALIPEPKDKISAHIRERFVTIEKYSCYIYTSIFFKKVLSYLNNLEWIIKTLFLDTLIINT